MADQPQSDYRYVPILRAKKGEFSALGCLSPAVKERITPLIEVQEMSDPDERSLEQHFARIALELARNWGAELEFFIEDEVTPDAATTASGSHPLVVLFGELNGRSLKATPVTGLARTAAYQMATASIASAAGRLCIRLEPDDFAQPSTLTSRIDALLAAMSLNAADTDLIVDFGSLPPNHGTMGLAITAALSAVPYITDWRSFTVAMTSFPLQLSSHVRTNSTGRVPRSGWLLYGQLLGGALARLPDYGDYGVDNPDTVLDLSPALMGYTMTASIRYSAEECWLIVRGSRLRDNGYDQYHDLAALIMAEPEYKGASFSWGDHYIDQCSRRLTGPGNQTTWRQVAVNHHITLVAEQLSNLP